MAVTPRGHRHCGRATKIFNSKPTTVTANEGTRLRASYLLCLLKAGQMTVKPRGRRQRIEQQANSGHGQRGHKTASKQCRSCERARQRDDGTAMINDLNEEIFCQASDSAAAPTFVERLMQWCLQRQKSNAREVMSPLNDMEHHLREGLSG